MSISKLDIAAKRRAEAIAHTCEQRRNDFAQHLTPVQTAKLAASMFSPTDDALACLDLGAGTGMLSAALADRYGGQIVTIDCVEADSTLASACDEDLADIPHRIIVTDALTGTPEKLYDRIILNPPYKKMASNDPRQRMLPVHSANLYSAFLAIALTRLEDDGEVVAIIPRSWTNGDYFTPFRKWALNGWSLDAMHIYGSRTEVFKDTNVLQETMLVRFSHRPQALTILVSESNTKSGEVSCREYNALDLIVGEGKVIRIAPSKGNIKDTVESRGYCPSTGKVVDFRSRDRIYMTADEAAADATSAEDIYRLVYAGNMRTGTLHHPASIGKCQWYRADDRRTRQQLTRPGSYVLVKRFSTKEEPRRVVAYPITITEPTAFENHTTFIHQGTPRDVIPLKSEAVAQGLSMWLNSTYIDEWFRDVSGSTQVNAKDIRAMPCPSESTLEEIGCMWRAGMNQKETDEAIGAIG